MSENEDQNLPISKYELQRLVYHIFKFNRSQLRFQTTLFKFAKSIGKENEIIEAYHSTILEEKKSLKKLLEGQLKYLYELKAPPPRQLSSDKSQIPLPIFY